MPSDPAQSAPRDPDVTFVGRVENTSPLDLVWAEASMKYLVDQPSKIRDAASKWGTSASAILAVAGLATAFKGRETLDAISAQARDPLIWTVLAAVLLAGAALFFAALATTGRTGRTWSDPTSFRTAQSAAAASASRWLELSKWGVALAFLAAVVAVGMIWTAPKATASASQTLVIGSQGVVLCGELKVESGQLTVGGQPLLQPPISVHSVAECPD